MSRHYIGFAPRGITVLRNVRMDANGEPLMLMNRTEVARLQCNFADFLETGETISSATAVAEGCTVAVATSSPNVTLTISDPPLFDGGLTLTVTMSTGDVVRQVVNVRQLELVGDETLFVSDYA